jgi:hypothetical protein
MINQGQQGHLSQLLACPKLSKRTVLFGTKGVIHLLADGHPYPPSYLRFLPGSAFSGICCAANQSGHKLHECHDVATQLTSSQPHRSVHNKGTNHSIVQSATSQVSGENE